jgi:GDPmannose 4,6-dehydratase
MGNRRALIFGVAGQDGTYLANLLLQRGYEVHGTSRDHEQSSFSNHRTLGIRDKLVYHSTDLSEFRSILRVVDRVEPHEIYNLAGQTSVGLSFEQPVEAFESIAVAVINILEVLRTIRHKTRFFLAGSSECFGNLDTAASELTPFRPRSPYALAKSAAFWSVANYREAYGLFACTGLLFNHESPLRPARFVTRKIVSSAVRISRGSKERLSLGNIEIMRDWGWAPEYVDAMYRMIQLDVPQDFVIATGEVHSLRDFVTSVFTALDLDWQSHVDIEQALFRPTDIERSVGDPKSAESVLGWRATVRFTDIVRRLVDAELDRVG